MSVGSLCTEELVREAWKGRAKTLRLGRRRVGRQPIVLRPIANPCVRESRGVGLVLLPGGDVTRSRRFGFVD